MDSTLQTPEGYHTKGTIADAGIGGANIPTTASLFNQGCEITDLLTGLIYVNRGTVAVPAWYTLGTLRKTVSISSADILAMYATPVVVLPALSNYGYIVDYVEFVMTRTSTAYANGGVVAVQYDSTANGGGTATTATIAATVVTGAAGTTYTFRIPVVQSDVASASIIGKGLYLSNATAAFITGTGTAKVTVGYHLINA